MIPNCRPACTQSRIPRVFEKMILSFLNSVFKSVITDEYHGFLEGRSTITNLYVCSNYVEETWIRDMK